MDQYCWEIIQCDDKSSCPARSSDKKQCWEVMEEHDSFQCHYGLCEECIVYLSKSDNSLLCREEMQEVLQHRGLYRQVLSKAM